MTITTRTMQQIGDVAFAACTSSLPNPTYYWFVDGIFRTKTTVPRYVVTVPAGAYHAVDVIDSTDSAYDPYAAETEQGAARRMVFTPVAGTDATSWRVQQQPSGGDWSTVRTVHVRDGVHTYEVITPRLDDGATYTWRAVPYDAAGNDGTPVTVHTEAVVRKPEPVYWTGLYSSGSNSIAISRGTV
jgi:hypothetical protein